MKPAGQELHLVVDRPLAAGPELRRAGRQPRVLETVRVPPDAVSFLDPGAPAAGLVRMDAAAGRWMLEPLVDGPHPRLLLLAPRGTEPPTVNGRGAPRVCLLRVGDQLLLVDGRLLHVTAYDRPRTGTASDEQTGRHCAFCRTPVEKGARVFTCPCGEVLHHDDPDRTTHADPLECAKLVRECRTCRRPIHLSGGFLHVPSFE